MYTPNNPFEDISELDDQSILQAANGFARFFRTMINRRQSFPIRPSEMGVLMYIKDNSTNEQGVKPSQIALQFKISKPSTTGIITSLQEKGYILRVSSKKDKRISYAVISPQGEQLIKSLFKDFYKNITLLADFLGKDDFSQLIHLLDRASEFMEENPIK